MALEQLSFYRRDEKSAGLFYNRLGTGVIPPEKTGCSIALSEICQGGNWNEISMEELRGQILLGEDDFEDSHRDLLHDKQEIKEIPRTQRILNRPKLSTLFYKGRNKSERDEEIH